MPSKVQDIDGRIINVDARNKGCPASVFLWGESFSMEFDRNTLVDAIKEAFGLMEPVDVALERLFAEYPVAA